MNHYPLSMQIDYSKIQSCFNIPKRSFEAGTSIYSYSENGDCIGILESGSAVIARVNMDGEVTVLERLPAGGVFGELIGFPPLPNDSVTVTAEEDCGLLFLSYKEVMRPCEKNCECHRALIDNLFKLISQKAFGLSERVEILSHKSIKEKLVSYFRISSARAGSLCFMLPFSLSALSDYICSDRSAMMRELKKLRESGLIKIYNRNVCIDSRLFELGI